MVALGGIPDFLGCINGQFVALELKKDNTSPPSALQAYILEKIRKAGGMAFVVSPENWEEIYAHLKLATIQKVIVSESKHWDS